MSFKGGDLEVKQLENVPELLPQEVFQKFLLNPFYDANSISFHAALLRQGIVNLIPL